MTIDVAEAEFVRLLQSLEGQDFEDAVCAFLQKHILDFQHVVAIPHGDAGLDGNSNNQSIGYCCYGPTAATKVNGQKAKAAIIRKFKADLETLFELEVKGSGSKKTYRHRPNIEIATVLSAGKKLSAIRLVVSVDHHQVIGPLREACVEYARASKCQYIEPNVSLIVWGPRQLLHVGEVDDAVIWRLQNKVVLAGLATAAASARVPADTNDFEDKFDYLERMIGQTAATRTTRNHFRDRWAEAIAIDDFLATNALPWHEPLASARQAATLDAAVARLGGASAADALQRSQEKLSQLLVTHIPKMPDAMRTKLADGETGRLIGECHIEWRKGK